MSRSTGLPEVSKATADVSLIPGKLDLVTFARKHRCRLRNLHDGASVPPARCTKAKGIPGIGYIGKEDRWDAIVGYCGYIADDGEEGQLGIYLHYGSARGVCKAQTSILEMGGNVRHVGDAEIMGSVPVDQIEEALQLIKVSKLRPGNARNFDRGPAQETHTS